MYSPPPCINQIVWCFRSKSWGMVDIGMRIQKSSDCSMFDLCQHTYIILYPPSGARQLKTRDFLCLQGLVTVVFSISLIFLRTELIYYWFKHVGTKYLHNCRYCFTWKIIDGQSILQSIRRCHKSIVKIPHRII
jgi:hypothetical protein